MQPQNTQPAPYYDDEISLLDLWRTLARRKLIIAVVSAAVMLAAGAYLLLTTPLYESRAVIQVGSMAGETGELIEDPNILRERLTAEHPAIDSVGVSRRSIVTITLQDASPAEAEQRLQAIVDQLFAEHNAVYENSKHHLEQRQRLQQQRINELKAQKSELGQFVESWKNKEPTAAAILIMEVGNIARMLPKLEQDLAALEQAPSEADADRTRLFGKLQTGERPVAPKTGLVLALAAVLGLMLGIFTAFFAEFLAKAREEQ